MLLYLPRLPVIGVFVVLVHALFLFCFCFYASLENRPLQMLSPQKLLVQTVHFIPRIAESPLPSQPQSTLVKKAISQAQIQKTPSKPKEEKPKVALKAIKKSLPDVKAKLLANAKEKLAKIQSPSIQKTNLPNLNIAPSKALTVPLLQTDKLSSSVFYGSDEPFTLYHDQLLTRLQNALRLPEYGKVEIEITVARSGKIVKLVVLNEESRNNRLYVETILPTLILPACGSFFGNETEKTFVITLINAM